MSRTVILYFLGTNDNIFFVEKKLSVIPFFNYKNFFLEISFANEIFILFLSNWKKKKTNEKLNKYVKTLKHLFLSTSHQIDSQR